MGLLRELWPFGRVRAIIKSRRLPQLPIELKGDLIIVKRTGDPKIIRMMDTNGPGGLPIRYYVLPIGNTLYIPEREMTIPLNDCYLLKWNSQLQTYESLLDGGKPLKDGDKFAKNVFTYCKVQ